MADESENIGGVVWDARFDLSNLDTDLAAAQAKIDKIFAKYDRPLNLRVNVDGGEDAGDVPDSQQSPPRSGPLPPREGYGFGNDVAGKLKVAPDPDSISVLESVTESVENLIGLIAEANKGLGGLGVAAARVVKENEDRPVSRSGDRRNAVIHEAAENYGFPDDTFVPSSPGDFLERLTQALPPPGAPVETEIAAAIPEPEKKSESVSSDPRATSPNSAEYQSAVSQPIVVSQNEEAPLPQRESISAPATMATASQIAEQAQVPIGIPSVSPHAPLPADTGADPLEFSLDMGADKSGPETDTRRYTKDRAGLNDAYYDELTESRAVARSADIAGASDVLAVDPVPLASGEGGNPPTNPTIAADAAGDLPSENPEVKLNLDGARKQWAEFVEEISSTPIEAKVGLGRGDGFQVEQELSNPPATSAEVSPLPAVVTELEQQQKQLVEKVSRATEGPLEDAPPVNKTEQNQNGDDDSPRSRASNSFLGRGFGRIASAYFVAEEGTRLVQADTQYNHDIALAGNDSNAQLTAELRHRDSIAGLGLGIGTLVEAANDPGGWGRIAIESQQRQIAEQDKYSDLVFQNISTQKQQLLGRQEGEAVSPFRRQQIAEELKNVQSIGAIDRLMNSETTEASRVKEDEIVSADTVYKSEKVKDWTIAKGLLYLGDPTAKSVEDQAENRRRAAIAQANESFKEEAVAASKGKSAALASEAKFDAITSSDIKVEQSATEYRRESDLAVERDEAAGTPAPLIKQEQISFERDAQLKELRGRLDARYPNGRPTTGGDDQRDFDYLKTEIRHTTEDFELKQKVADREFSLQDNRLGADLGAQHEELDAELGKGNFGNPDATLATAIGTRQRGLDEAQDLARAGHGDRALDVLRNSEEQIDVQSKEYSQGFRGTQLTTQEIESKLQSPRDVVDPQKRMEELQEQRQKLVSAESSLGVSPVQPVSPTGLPADASRPLSKNRAGPSHDSAPASHAIDRLADSASRAADALNKVGTDGVTNQLPDSKPSAQITLPASNAGPAPASELTRSPIVSSPSATTPPINVGPPTNLPDLQSRDRTSQPVVASPAPASVPAMEKANVPFGYGVLAQNALAEGHDKLLSADQRVSVSDQKGHPDEQIRVSSKTGIEAVLPTDLADNLKHEIQARDPSHLPPGPARVELERQREAQARLESKVADSTKHVIPPTKTTPAAAAPDHHEPKQRSEYQKYHADFSDPVKNADGTYTAVSRSGISMTGSKEDFENVQRQGMQQNFTDPDTVQAYSLDPDVRSGKFGDRVTTNAEHDKLKAFYESQHSPAYLKLYPYSGGDAPTTPVNKKPAGTVAAEHKPETPQREEASAVQKEKSPVASPLQDLKVQRASDQKSLAAAFQAKRNSGHYQQDLDAARDKVHEDDASIAGIPKRFRGLPMPQGAQNRINRYNDPNYPNYNPGHGEAANDNPTSMGSNSGIDYGIHQHRADYNIGAPHANVSAGNSAAKVDGPIELGRDTIDKIIAGIQSAVAASITG